MALEGRALVPLKNPLLIGPGTIIMVVGPSGSGKDTLLKAAADELFHDPDFTFPKRVITRTPDPESEDHDEITMEQFRAIRETADYGLCWEAHDKGYIIPASIKDDVRAGKCVVFNGSRGAILSAMEVYENVRVVSVTVPNAILASRLARRGRESHEEIEKRLERAAFQPPAGVDLTMVSNEGPVEQSVSDFIKSLRVLSDY